MGGPGFVLSLSQDGVVHSLEVNVNTQQSCNLNNTEAPDDDYYQMMILTNHPQIFRLIGVITEG